MNVMTQAARKAGRVLSRDFGEVENLQISIKGPADFVTAADRRAETIIYEELSRARPGYGFLMEERGEIEGADKTHRWIVDPLDGTTNFLHGIPIFAISIALEREGEIVAGLVYNPASGDTFAAERGKGAFLDDRRIRVAGRDSLEECVIATGIPHRGKPDHDIFLREYRTVMSRVAGLRRMGAASLDLAWVAAGRFDGYWERNLKAWDIAAGMLLVKEAGGYVTSLAGEPDMLSTGGVVAANDHIHHALLGALGECAAAA